MNYVTGRVGRAQAIELYDRLDESVGFEFVRTTKRDDQIAIDRLRSSSGISFVDATIASYAGRVGMEYCYSFDDDLDCFDELTRIADPVDPYGPE